MKKLNRFLILSLLSFAVIFYGCEDRSDLTAPTVKTGSADFSRFVIVGNSLTAGYQNGTLYESSQKYSYGKLIADQVGAKYEQPIIGDPGTGGRMEIASFNADGTPNIVYNPNKGEYKNLSYPAPYNNLGIPGAWLPDALLATDSNSCVTGQTSPNPYFNLVLRGMGTQIHQAMMQQPTFVIFWLGNNDILGHAATGGVAPYTPEATFAGVYSMAMDSLTATGANVLVANIPYVTSTPYFTTIGPKVGLAIKPAVDAGLAYGLYYQKSTDVGAVPATQFATPDDLIADNVILTLAGSTFAGMIGDTTGASAAYYQSIGVDPAAVGVDVHQPFGLHPQNPYPNPYTLDADELANIKNVIDSYNNSIATLASAHGFTLVDINTFFSGVATSGLTSNGLKFTSDYITGNMFALDGVHPTTRGYGIIANQFIKVINATFNAEIPLVDVATLPNSILLQGFYPQKGTTNGFPHVDPSIMYKVQF